jgi:hypothetical protein
MAIPKAQLETWANPGALTTSAAAYASIRNALLKSSSPVANLGLDIHLQGSYANSTNIYGDSDIDVVVLYSATFYEDLSALTLAEHQIHVSSGFVTATYNWPNLRDDVLRALRAHYGNGAVNPGKKSIKVTTGSGRRPSDVVPAMQFRRYATFPNAQEAQAHWGIQFFDSANNPIVNYPKYHKERGEDKNSATRTGGRYKPTIRIFKNFRNYLIDHGLLAEGIASSYHIECALHNVPDHLFIGDYTATIPAIITHLLTAPFNSLRCQNGVTDLIGTGATQWSENDFTAFIIAAQNGWDNF